MWALHLALPVAASGCCSGSPPPICCGSTTPSHFWLVLVVAAVNVVVGLRMSIAARAAHRRATVPGLAGLPDQRGIPAAARAGHARGSDLARQLGFDISQPVGLAVASVFAVLSCLPWPAARAPEKASAVGWVGLPTTAVPAASGRWSRCCSSSAPAGRMGRRLAARPAPLNQPPQARDVEGPLAIVAVVAVALYLIAAVRFYLLHRRAPAAVLLSLVTAFVLLAEAMVAVGAGQQVAPVLVGVARPAHVRVRVRGLQRLRAVPPGGHQRRPVRRDRAGRDQPPDPGRVRRRPGGAGHRAARARTHRADRGASLAPAAGRAVRADRGPDGRARPGRHRSGHRTRPDPAPGRAGRGGRAGPGRAGRERAAGPRCCAGSGRPTATCGSASSPRDSITVDGRSYDPETLHGPHDDRRRCWCTRST